MTEDSRRDLMTRRQTLGAVGAAGAGLLVARTAGLPGLVGADAAGAADTPSCVLTPEEEEGPYYADLEKVRSNIIAGRPGVPLILRIHVLDSDSCKPIKNAAVDIWHCDALGVYSDESKQGTVGQTWLRGVQLTDKNGLAHFTTIYPGHYPGRNTHIHVKVHIGGSRSGSRYSGGHVSHTGQLFFSDTISKRVYKLSPYSKDHAAFQPRATDQVYAGEHGSSSVLKLRSRGSSLRRSGLTATIALGVDPSSTPSAV